METMAGHPTLLAGFRSAVSSPRVGTDWEQSAVLTRNNTVASGCPGRAVSVPALAQVDTLLEAMAANETWLDAIAEALAEADADDYGIASLTEAEVDLALENAGVSTDAPDATEFAETTRMVVAPTSGLIDDPINAANGNMIHPEHDLAFPAIAAALNVSRTWNSLLADQPGAFGCGWSSVYDMVLDIGQNEVTAHLSDGNAVGFTRSGDGWEAPSVERLVLVETDGGWTLDTDQIRRFHFDRFGVLTGWHVGVARVSVERDDAFHIVRVAESVTGRSLSVEWSDGAGPAADVITSITAADGRSLRYERADDATLLGVTSDSGSVTYRWQDDLLVAVVDPDGVELFVNTYDEDRRVVGQVSPFGRVSSYTYRDDGMTVITDADGVTQAMRHDRFGDMVDVIDLDGSRMHLDYDHLHRAVKIVERDGATWTYRYDGDDQVERVDPDGLRLTQLWDAQHRVTEATDRAGFTTRMEYDTDHVAPSRVIQPNGGVIHQQLDERGLPTEIVDADGVVNRFTWDSDGQLVATHDAFGAATEFDYDPYGYLRGIAPATGNPTVMELAPGGRVLRTTCGDATWEYGYTAAGRVRGGAEPGDLAWSATFGPHGAMASVSDATGATVGFDYDASGNLTATTAPDGDVYRNIFDDVGRLTAAVDPTGATVAQTHDRRGRVVEVTDPLGNTWHREMDIMSRSTASTAPDGTTTRWTYDAAGNAIGITGPDGRVWGREFDHEGRPVAIIDPTGGRATIEYSPAGRVTARTSPAGRTERFEYDIAGRLGGIVGIDGVRREARRDDRGRIESMIELDASGTPSSTVEYRWDDGYRLVGVTRTGDDRGTAASSSVVRDAGGRVTEAVDASGVRTHYDWDERGLVASATDPSGASTTYDYDVRGRLAGVTTPGERTHSIAYGADGRASSITDPAGVVTSMLRNASGAVTGQRVGAGSDDEVGWNRTLDAMGRESSRSSLDGSITSSYEYDAAGRLLSAGTGDDEVTIGFLFDDNDLLESVEGPDGTRIIERDADGWVVSTVDPDGTRTEFQRDAAGRIIGADSSAGDDRDAGLDERDRAGRLTIGRDGTVFRYDDAARIAEIAPVDGVPRTFRYGDDGLLASETGPTGRRDFEYDAAGRVIGVVTDVGLTTIGYDTTGRRISEIHPDDSTTSYVWDALGRLARTERTDDDGSLVGTVEVVYDAMDRPAFVNGQPVGHHALTGLAVTEPFVPGGTRAFGGVPVGDVFVIGARALDPITHQFLSSDPLLPAAGSNGAASGYTYSWHDPINWIDPTGMRPISLEDYEAYQAQNDKGTFAKAWDTMANDPWGTLAMVAVTAVGVGLMFVPGGQVIGAGILIGVATTSAVGLATGNFNPRDVALGGAFGAIPGGSTVRGAALIGAGSGFAETTASSYLNGNGMPSAHDLVVSTASGGTLASGGRAMSNVAPNNSTAAAIHTPDTPAGSNGVNDLLGGSDDFVVLGRQADTAVAQDWPGHAVLDTPEWSLQLNDDFISGAISQQRTVYLASPFDGNLVQTTGRFAGEPTIYARELEQLTNAGYRRVGDYMVPP